MAHSLIVVTIFVALAQGYTTFHTNCTVPNTSANFVSSPGTRGTIDILWSYLFTILACTWTVQHLNVPEQREDRDPGWLGDIKWACKRTWKSAQWMFWTAIVPEMLMSKNMGDLLAVKSDIKRFQELALEDGVPWTATHSLFADMGGFVIRSHVPERSRGFAEAKTSPDSSEPDRESSRTQDSAESERRKGISKVESQGITTKRSHSNPFHLVARDILALREAKLLRLPYITKSELNDKSKSDGLVRFIAVLQILWTAIQITVRYSRHLAIFQLEIAVVAFSICAIIIYGLNWEKPKGVQVPYTLLQFSGQIPKTILTKTEKDWENSAGIWDWTFEMLMALLTLGQYKPSKDALPGSPVPNHSIATELNKSAGIAQVLGLLLGGLVFGSIHVLAWNFVFASPIERTLWRVASILCITMPLLFLVALVLFAVLDKRYHFLRRFLLRSQPFYILLYVAGRLFLLMEIFKTLCFLPPSAYVATWATNIPHIA